MIWDEAQNKFNLTVTNIESWALLTSKIINQWRHLLEDDPLITHPGQWVGLYNEGVDNLGFVVRCSYEFTPLCTHQHHIIMPLSNKCFTVGTHSICLGEWEHPIIKMIDFFHHVKIIHTTRWQKK